MGSWSRRESGGDAASSRAEAQANKQGNSETQAGETKARSSAGVWGLAGEGSEAIARGVRCSAEWPVGPAIGDGREGKGNVQQKPRPNANNATITRRPSRAKEEKKRRLLSWSRDPGSQKGREVGSWLCLEVMQSQNQVRNDVDCGLFVQPSRVRPPSQPLAGQALRRPGCLFIT